LANITIIVIAVILIVIAAKLMLFIFLVLPNLKGIPVNFHHYSLQLGLLLDLGL